MKNVALIMTLALLIAGCASKNQGSQTTANASGASDFRITTAFTPDPPRKGAETLTVTLMDAAGAPVKGATVKVDSAMPSMSMTGPSVSAHDNGDGTYSAHLALEYATDWQFAISAKIDGKTAVAQVKSNVR